MTEARTMQVTEDSAASKTEQLAHGRPVVERWLTWSGLVPLPAFLLLHLGRELWLSFATDVSDVLRPPSSWFTTLSALLLVWLPLGVHVTIAVYFALSGRQLSPTPADDVPRVARVVSRISSLFALAFVAYHAKTYALAVWLGDADARDAGFRLMAQLSSTRFGVPLVGGAYLLGLVATLTHAGLGVQRGLLAEGRLNEPATRRASARLCAAFGVALFCVGAAAVIRVASGVLLR